MPFRNTTEPKYLPDQPAFLRDKKKAAFDGFVTACQNGSSMEDEKFKELFGLRWANFADGLIDDNTIIIDVLFADRSGFTVDLQAAFDHWLDYQTRAKSA